MSILQRMYDSEISFTIEVAWDGGFDLMLGHDMPGHKIEEANVRTWADAEEWFNRQIRQHYPDSYFVTGRHPYGKASHG